MSARKPPVGSIVQWTPEHLRSTGRYTGVPTDGLVVCHPGGRWISVQWCDADAATLVHPGNVKVNKARTAAYQRMNGGAK